MPGGVRFGAAGNNGLRVRKSGCVRGDSVPAVMFCCRGMSSPDGPDRFPHPGKCRMAGFPGGGSCPVFLRSVGRGRSGAGLSDRSFEPMGRPACRRCLSPMREGLERSGSVSRRRLRTTGTEVAPSQVLTDIDKNPFGRCRTSAVLSGEVGGVSGRRSPERIARPMSRSGRTGAKIMKAGRCLVRLESYLSDRASCRRYRAMNERSRPCGMRPCLRLAGRIREGGGAVCSAFPDEIEKGERMFEPFAARETVFG